MWRHSHWSNCPLIETRSATQKLNIAFKSPPRKCVWRMRTTGTRLPDVPCRRQVPGPWFNIKMSSYQYRKSHCGDKTVVRSSYLHNGSSYTGKTTSLYWIRAQDANFKMSNVSPDIKMSSYHYSKSHCGDKTILRPSPQWDFLYW